MSILDFRRRRWVQRTCWACQGSGVHQFSACGRVHREICRECAGLGVREVETSRSWVVRLARAIGLAR